MNKEKKGGSFLWQKVFLIMIGVLFAGMMIISAMGPSWLQSFRTVRANDSVTLDFTLRDTLGQPVLTSDQNLYRASVINGGITFLTSPVTVRAGYTGSPAITGLDAENYYMGSSGLQLRFGLFGQELDEMNLGVLGMKTGQAKTIRFNFSDPLTISLKDYEFTAMGGNFSTIAVGDLIPLGLSETPVVSGLEGYNETPQNAAYRIAMVINKTGNSLEIQHRYPQADITVRSIS
jgi:hypothetical protein